MTETSHTTMLHAGNCRVCKAVSNTNYDNLCVSCVLVADAAPVLLAGAKAILAARSGQASIDAVIQLRDAIAKAEGRNIPDEDVSK